MGEPARRRRRHRSSAAPVPAPPPVPEPAAGDETAAGSETVIETTAVADPEEPVPAPVGRRPARPVSGGAPPAGTWSSGRRGEPDSAGGDDTDRGLRGLVGSGSSQVSVGAALRARDAARPTDAQLAEAEQSLTIVRRNWTPRDELPRRPSNQG